MEKKHILFTVILAVLFIYGVETYKSKQPCYEILPASGKGDITFRLNKCSGMVYALTNDQQDDGVMKIWVRIPFANDSVLFYPEEN